MGTPETVVIAAGVAASVAAIVVVAVLVGHYLFTRGLSGPVPVLVLDDAETEAYDQQDADNPLI